MSALAEIEQGIESLLGEPPYGVDSQQRRRALLALLKSEIAYACYRNPRFRNSTSKRSYWRASSIKRSL